MPIKKRTNQNTYAQFREEFWKEQGGATHGVAFRKSTMNNGEPITDTFLEPKKNIFLNDVWHCESPEAAKELVAGIVTYPDIEKLELKHKWVFVRGRGNDHILEGQETDGRSTVTG